MDPVHNHAVELVRQAFEWVALGIEVLGVAVIVAGVLFAGFGRGTLRYLFQPGYQGASDESYKQRLGKPLILALELLVAADIVKTVAGEPTLLNVSVLGLLVVVRTILSWTLEVEMEGHWPWRGSAEHPPAAERGSTGLDG